MRLRFCWLGSVFYLTSLGAWAERVPHLPIFAEAPIERFNPIQHPRFKYINSELNNLVGELGDYKINNMFCASGFVLSDGKPITMVIWKNKDWLYWWRGSSYEPDRENAQTLLRARYSNLKTAVEDGAILGGPTTVNRSQVKSVTEDCEKYGQKYLIKPFTPAPQKEESE